MTRTPLRSTAFLAAVLALAGALSSGCATRLDLGLGGEWSDGERGRTRWQLVDGLCPGLGGCALDVPLAVGARPTVQVDRVDGRGLDATGDDVVEVVAYDVGSGDPPAPLFPIEALAPGTGTLTLLDPSGDELDRVRVEVRRATRLECGALPESEPVAWDVPALEPTSHLVLPLAPPPGSTGGSSGSPGFQLVCRAADDAGPLLSVQAIEWTVIEGDDVLRLRNDALLDLGGPVRGARIRYTPLAAGTARVRATLGDVVEELEITLEASSR